MVTKKTPSKTRTRKKKSKNVKNRNVDIETIFRYLYVLEQNEGNISATAREIGFARQTLWQWKQKHWKDYLMQKGCVREQTETIAAVKLATVEHFAEIRGIMTTAMKLCINRAIDIMKDPEEVQKLKFYELTDFIHKAGPYTIDKIMTMGAEDPNRVNGNQPTFIQNIIHELNVRGQRAKQQNLEILQDAKTED